MQIITDTNGKVLVNQDGEAFIAPAGGSSNTIAVDTAATEGSSNLITSGAVKTGLNGKADSTALQTEVTRAQQAETQLGNQMVTDVTVDGVSVVSAKVAQINLGSKASQTALNTEIARAQLAEQQLGNQMVKGVKMNGVSIVNGQGVAEFTTSGYAEKTQIFNNVSWPSPFIPGVYYVFSTVTGSKTVTLDEFSSSNLEETTIEFSVGTSVPTITWPNVKWVDGEAPALQANKTYVVSFFRGFGVYAEF